MTRRHEDRVDQAALDVCAAFVAEKVVGFKLPAGGVAFPSQELFEKAKSAMRKLDDADPEHAGFLAAYFSKLTTAFGWLSGHWSTARTEIDEVKQWCEPAVVSGRLKHSAQELVSVLTQHLGRGKEKEGGGGRRKRGGRPSRRT